MIQCGNMARHRGKLIENGVQLKPHEMMTVNFFLDRGDDIELLVPSNTAKNKNPDWVMWGKIWETKSPQTTNINTLLVTLKRASRQSVNLIIDLRRVRGDDMKVFKVIQSKFLLSKRFKYLLIIKKDGELVELRK